MRRVIVGSTVGVGAASTWIPETRYARNGDVHIAYQVFGDGDVTFVGLPGIVSNIEVIWENEEIRRYLTTIASYCRFVIYDKRGQGLSDRDTGVPTLDERIDDLTAVLDAAGCDRVALGGISEGGSTAAMYAATYPQRVSHLVLYGSFARVDGPRSDDFMEHWATLWATPETPTVELIAPSNLGDEDFRRWVNRWERQSGTPGGLLAAWRWIRAIDVRPILGSIQCPTLVMHRTGDRLVRASFSRELAELIPGASFVELEGADHAPQWGGLDAVLENMLPFLTGRPAAPKPPERVLATILFTDIVDSTATASRVGDATWRSQLDRHDEISRRIVTEFGGRLVKGTGDGILASFDAPGRAVRCADALRAVLASHGMTIRAGLHTGEVELRGEDVSGIGVHIAARVNALANANEVLVTRTIKDLVVGSDFGFSSRGLHELKGIPDQWELLAVAEPG